MSIAIRTILVRYWPMAIAPSPAPVRQGDDYGPSGRSDWMDIDWREHLGQVTVGGRRVNYVELGDGPPLVFVHGLGGCWENWLENIPHFARTHRVVALDLPGFGESEMPAEGISIPGYARSLNEFCDALELGSPTLVGNSMGGFIAAEVAVSFPERVDRLVLVSAAALSSEHDRRQPVVTVARMAGPGAAWFASRVDAVSRRPRLRAATLRVGRVVRHPERLPGPLVAELLRGSGTKGFVHALDALLSYSFRDRLPKIGCPTLIVWGRQDALVPVGDADEFESLIADSRKVIFEDTGHMAMVERPARFNALVDDFLAV
jgi:pimeloyl-ACP methyl ester carboxylesterase